ncbi:hypothetical protein BCR32DRAFT_272881 [Anaeromyces robustus]|uniref:Zincin n=1 Tax=Anaeromyces robustus TaxID=1754192 RepID=A0A1Y1VUL3_9FUNG|nr:hypothetical protein BCR32DRAFT_272881 [Anaeromyces robustus]|eukprot:ORX64980.1 hypothetical protein BCR32DRAFT_272881 [Anaeromyces robustus]
MKIITRNINILFIIFIFLSININLSNAQNEIKDNEIENDDNLNTNPDVEDNIDNTLKDNVKDNVKDNEIEITDNKIDNDVNEDKNGNLDSNKDKVINFDDNVNLNKTEITKSVNDTEINVYESDIFQDEEKKEKKKSNKEIIEKLEIPDQLEQWSSVETDNFNVYIYCINEDSKCKIYKKQLKKVLKTIENIFEFKEVINISLFLMRLNVLCEGSCLGIVIPPNFVYLKEDKSDIVYSYPQALAKQLKIKENEGGSFSPLVDFTVVLNIDLEKEDIETMGEFSIAREILHGMGIVNTGDLVNSNKYQLFSEDFYAPQRAIEFTFIEEDVNGVYVKFNKFYPLSIFERYIVTQDNPNNYIFDSLTEMYTTNYPTQEYNFMNATAEDEKVALTNAYQTFLNSEYYLKAREIASIYTKKGSVGFKANDGTIIPLQTFDGEYYKSLSINHIDIPKINTEIYYDYDPFDKNEIKNYLNEDFIMNYTYMFMYDVDTIASIVASKNKHGIIGPGVINILKTIGWTEKGEKSLPKEYIMVDVDINNDNYMDLFFRSSSQHDYYGFSSSSNKNMCDPKAYVISLLTIGILTAL